MENFANISGPQTPQMSKKINKYNFLSVYSSFNERNAISSIETE